LPSESKTRRTLDNALLAIERRLDDYRSHDREKDALPARRPVEWMAPTHQHLALGGLHALECPQCAV
jgi:hypothetical protein